MCIRDSIKCVKNYFQQIFRYKKHKCWIGFIRYWIRGFKVLRQHLDQFFFFFFYFNQRVLLLYFVWSDKVKENSGEHWDKTSNLSVLFKTSIMYSLNFEEKSLSRQFSFTIHYYTIYKEPRDKKHLSSVMSNIQPI